MKLMDQLHSANGLNVRTDEQVSRMREPAMRKSARRTASLRKQTKSYCASGEMRRGTMTAFGGKQT